MNFERGSLHEDQIFEGLDLRDGLSSVEFVDCSFVSCQLPEAGLERCRFEQVSFRACDLSVVRWGGSALVEVVFEDCKLTGIDWSRAHDLSFEVAFRSSVLDLCSFVGLRLKGLSVEEGRARDAVFADSDLRNARFRYVDLAGATFTGNDLRGADLSTCANIELEPGTNRLAATKLPMEAARKHLKALGIVVPSMEE